MAKVRKTKRFSIELAHKHPTYLFVFGDNLVGNGQGGQAIIRYCKNSFGIPTKKLPSSLPDSFFNDDQFDFNVEKIKESVDQLVSLSDNFEFIVFPEDGLGTGLAQLPEKAPKTYRFLVECINSNFGQVYQV